MGACTPKQAKVLEKYGYDTDVDFDRASQIIDALASNGWKKPATLPAAGAKPARGSGTQTRPRTAPGRTGTKSYDGPATAKQCAVLEKYGYDSAGKSFAEASKLIDRIAANGWKRPDFDDDDDLGNDPFEGDDDLDNESDDEIGF